MKRGSESCWFSQGSVRCKQKDTQTIIYGPRPWLCSFASPSPSLPHQSIICFNKKMVEFLFPTCQVRTCCIRRKWTGEHGGSKGLLGIVNPRPLTANTAVRVPRQRPLIELIYLVRFALHWRIHGPLQNFFAAFLSTTGSLIITKGLINPAMQIHATSAKVGYTASTQETINASRPRLQISANFSKLCWLCVVRPPKLVRLGMGGYHSLRRKHTLPLGPPHDPNQPGGYRHEHLDHLQWHASEARDGKGSTVSVSHRFEGFLEGCPIELFFQLPPPCGLLEGIQCKTERPQPVWNLDTNKTNYRTSRKNVTHWLPKKASRCFQHCIRT